MYQVSVLTKQYFLLKLCFIKAIAATSFHKSSVPYKPDMEVEQSEKLLF